MRTLKAILTAGAVLGVALSLGACGGPSRAGRGGTPQDFAAWTPEAGAFDPVRMRVHPLTRITRDADGTAVLACHIELRDAANQVVKALGVAQVELFVVDSKGHADATGQTWEVDLRDAQVNAEAFDDVVTRTYVLRLGSLPAAAARLADAVAPGDEAPSYGVAVRFIFKGAGEPDGARTLEVRATLTEP